MSITANLYNAAGWLHGNTTIPASPNPYPITEGVVVSCPGNVSTDAYLVLDMHTFLFSAMQSSSFTLSTHGLENEALKYPLIELISGQVKVTKNATRAAQLLDPTQNFLLTFLIRVKTAGTVTGSKGTIFTVSRGQLGQGMTTVIDVIDDEVSVTYRTTTNLGNVINDSQKLVVNDQPFPIAEIDRYGNIIKPQKVMDALVAQILADANAVSADGQASPRKRR